MKVISFSLWGDNPIYLVGALRNAELAIDMYPDFYCWFYVHEDTVPKHIIDSLSLFENTRIIFKHGNLVKPRMWRFEPIQDPCVELFMSRDVDTRFLLREKLAVEEWLKSDRLLHIMRDHPWHNAHILAGMFGIKKSNISFIKEMFDFSEEGHYDYDQIFLEKVVYPLYQNNRIIHASFHKLEGDECQEFHVHHKDDDYRFIGEYVYEDEKRNPQNIIELKRGFI